MEIIEYESRYSEENKKRYNVLGYTLGLIGSSMSFVISFVSLILFLVVNEFVQMVITYAVSEVFDELDIVHFFISPDKFYNLTHQTYTFAYQLGVIFLIIMIVGFILSLYGTISYKKKPSSLACTLMIIGGMLSLVSLFIPGVITIVGGSINLFNLVRDSK